MKKAFLSTLILFCMGITGCGPSPVQPGSNDQPNGPSLPSGREPEILVSPSSGPIGTTFYLQLSGFPANETIDIYLKNEETHEELIPLQAVADSNGSAQAELTSQSGDHSGYYLVEAISETESYASTRIRFESTQAGEGGPQPEQGPAPSNQAAEVRVSPKSAPLGSTHDLSLYYFPPNETVLIYVTYDETNEQVLVLSVVTDSHGNAKTGLASETGDGIGYYTIEAIGETDGYATSQIFFEADAAAQQPSNQNGESSTITIFLNDNTPINIPRCGTPEFETRASEYNAWVRNVYFDIDGFWKRETKRLGWDYHASTMIQEPRVEACGEYVNYPESPYYQYPSENIYLQDNWMFPAYIEWGRISVAYVIAHELSHHVAFASGRFASLEGTEELKTDCWAGAYLRDSLARGFIDAQILPQINDFLTFVADTSLPYGWFDDPGFHGNSFSRVTAVQEGLEGGLESCRF